MSNPNKDKAKSSATCISIVCDTREQHGAISYIEAAIDLKQAPINVLTKQLTIGDYAILLNGRLVILFERKTWKDLAASIKDGRMKSQQANMITLAEKGVFVFYIIEGKANFEDETEISHMKFKLLHAKLRHNMLRGLSFIQTKNAEKTAALLANFANDVYTMYEGGELAQFALRDDSAEKNPDKKITTTPSKKTPTKSIEDDMTHVNKKPRAYVDDVDDIDVDYINKTQSYEEDEDEEEEVDIEAIPVSEEDMIAAALSDFCDLGGPVRGGKAVRRKATVDEVPEELTIRRERTRDDIMVKMWNAVTGVSVAVAQILVAAEYTPPSVLRIDVEKLDAIIDKIAMLKRPSGMALGEKMAMKIMAITNRRSCKAVSAEMINLEVAMIATIPGISETKARPVCNRISMHDICCGRISDMDIVTASRDVAGKKTLGIALANRILETLTK